MSVRLSTVLVGTIAAAMLPGCNPALFFDGVHDTPPPTRKVRRDLELEIAQLARELDQTRAALEAAEQTQSSAGEPVGPPVEQADAWVQAAALLPADYAGNVDWVAALVDGVIKPRPGLVPGTPEQAVFDLAIPFASNPDPANHVNFSHDAHTRWLTCKNCHPAIFPLGAERTIQWPAHMMAAIRDGRYCGACHGKVAFSVANGCARCHDGLPHQADWQPPAPRRTAAERARTWEEVRQLLPDTQTGIDWMRALAEEAIKPRAGIDPAALDQPVFPLTVEMTPAAGAMFKVAFPHASHTALLTCASCHPAIFEMRAGANKISMATILAGEHCGRCHGSVAFAVPTACDRCHPALAQAR